MDPCYGLLIILTRGDKRQRESCEIVSSGTMEGLKEKAAMIIKAKIYGLKGPTLTWEA
jgi:hypothetical protein